MTLHLRLTYHLFYLKAENPSRPKIYCLLPSSSKKCSDICRYIGIHTISCCIMTVLVNDCIYSGSMDYYRVDKFTNRHNNVIK